MAKAKQNEKEKKYSLKEMLKYMELKEDEEVLIHLYNKQITTGPICVKDISQSLLKKKIKMVQPRHGGKEHNHNLWMFIVE